MKIHGLAYIIIGIFVAAVSGYVYKYIPKNNEPNTSMAIFFFVGIIFIVVGFAKLFLRKIDRESDENMQSIIAERHKHTLEKHHIHKTVDHHTTAQTHNQPTHTSHYSQTHPYHGIHPPNAQQPSHHLSIILCKKCNNHNPINANYCHKCGYRLK
ncbi:TPA: hypothetical protein HA235_03675 [Candidatus Woesearchaeota archaeon]|nr:hypothetical protein [Candidatus Woesearchaeota archaeon]HIH31781.1 hypothetical protein [Candidatus Woesearchaeota archaeon]HIH54658.1 hypothetical protein [Candidatus Woesearchaeota archaeon]HIJ01545.1 hypothetical protein [Candidatus Woesearchaeota archaeon]HIJ13948.1 hypothetical protein [Candidatus Woesearchaeota archaeon]